jgi:hypothetical protein
MGRIVELCAAYEATHGRPPSTLDMVSIRVAARLCAAAESPQTPAVEATRTANALHKTLGRLGLAKPAKPGPASPTLRDWGVKP